MFIPDMKNDEKKIDKKNAEKIKSFSRRIQNLQRIHLFQSVIGS